MNAVKSHILMTFNNQCL